MHNPTLTKNFVCGAAVTGLRIVKFGADDNHVIQAAAVSDALMGISDSVGGSSSGRMDVHLEGVAEVEYGGTVTRGDLLTSDANGKAIKAAPALGATQRTIGYAVVSGVSGDIGACLLAPAQILLLTESKTAGAAIAASRIVKHGDTDAKAVQAAAVTDDLFGIADANGAANGAACIVYVGGVAPVEYGGNVTRGNLLTSDADGKAVAAAPAAGVNNRIIGVARVSGVATDIGSCQISPGQIQGA